MMSKKLKMIFAGLFAMCVLSSVGALAQQPQVVKTGAGGIGRFVLVGGSCDKTKASLVAGTLFENALNGNKNLGRFSKTMTTGNYLFTAIFADQESPRAFSLVEVDKNTCQWTFAGGTDCKYIYDPKVGYNTFLTHNERTDFAAEKCGVTDQWSKPNSK